MYVSHVLCITGAEDFADSLGVARTENTALAIQLKDMTDRANGLGAQMNHHRLESSYKTTEIMTLRATLAAKEQWISHQNVQIEDLKGRVFTFAANAVETDTKPEDP